MAIYTFDEFELDLSLYELRRAGEPCPLEPQVFDVLAYLVRQHDRLVSKDELLDAIWGHRFVTEANLNSRVMAARKALGDTGQDQRFIRTVRGRGYRFIAAVAERPGEAASPPLRAPCSVLRVGEEASPPALELPPSLTRSAEHGAAAKPPYRSSVGTRSWSICAGSLTGHSPGQGRWCS